MFRGSFRLFDKVRIGIHFELILNQLGVKIWEYFH